jgi:hypothetical protein
MGAACPCGPDGVEERGIMKAVQTGIPHHDAALPGVQGIAATRSLSSGWLVGESGLAGRVALSWGLAGGLSMEAILVLAALLAHTPASTSDPLAATFFFLLGVLGGFVHGALVGVIGRPERVELSRAVRSVERAAVVLVPLAVLAWGAALWISLTSTEVAASRPTLLVAVGAGWAILTGATVWALWEARAALRYALVRWPIQGTGWMALLVVSATLMVSFVWWRPEIWFTDVRTTALGAAFLGLGVTIWFALPAVMLGLHLLRRRGTGLAGPVPDPDRGAFEGE